MGICLSNCCCVDQGPRTVDVSTDCWGDARGVKGMRYFGILARIASSRASIGSATPDPVNSALEFSFAAP